jgi:hypothetical protein
MFLANSFKEKLKRSYLEGEMDAESTEEAHQYKPNKKDPRVLFSFKDTYKSDPLLSSSSNLNSQQLKALDKKEWENTFTLKKLHQKWKGKTELDFEPNFKKFTDEASFPQAKPAKEYVKNLRDPDILELKQKYWNISNNTKEKYKTELKKNLFEISAGLKDFKIVPLKNKIINEGVDSRDHIEIDGNSWNISNLVNKKKFKIEENENLSLAQENSNKYWKENEENREEEKPFPLDEERKKIEIIRYFKKYRSPIQKSIDFYNTMDKVKELTFIEKELAEKKVIKNNPGILSRYPEKINALVFKELNETYKDKYKELTGKLSKEELKKRQIEQNRFKWTDTDLANKITAINKLRNSGILNLEMDKNSSAIRLSKSQNRGKRNILLPLVVKGNEIEREEDKIKEKLQEEFKKQKKLEMLLESKTFKKKKKIDKFISKYPISKQEYDFNKNYEKKLQADFSNKKEDKLDKKISYIIATSPNINNEMTNSIMNEISKNADCDPHFLEAYTIVAGKELERINNVEKKNKENIKYEYSHPGTYRDFVFTEKVKKKKTVNKLNENNNGENGNDNEPKFEGFDEYEDKKVKSKFWSCCMNSDPNSPGCQKKIVKNFKYLYD